MKAIELMIGDLVNVTKYGKPVRVGAVYSTMIIPNPDDDDPYASIGDEHLEPIPLTHDIIKTNGFEMTEVGDNGISTPRKNLNRYEKHECKTKWRDITIWYDRMTKKWCLHGLNNIQLSYVHELQHALRMCGIEELKTIKL